MDYTNDTGTKTEYFLKTSVRLLKSKTVSIISSPRAGRLLAYSICLALILLTSLACHMPGRNQAAALTGSATQDFYEQFGVTSSPGAFTTISAAPEESPEVLAPSATTAPPTQTTYPTAPPVDWGDSPPPGKIVYVCYVNQVDQICLMNADGSNQVQLTNTEATSFYPSLSPDGQEIVFSSSQDGSFEIYSMKIDGSGLTKLTDNIGALYAPEISPDGTLIVFTNQRKGRQALWIMNRDGGNPRELTPGPLDDGDPSWSGDGQMLAFASDRTGDNQLFTMQADGSNIFQVTNLPDMGGRNDWSPDGGRLVFYAGPRSPYYNRNIFIINSNGTGLQQLTTAGDNLGPAFSPDGKWITFTSFRDGNNEIYIMHPDGTGQTRLTYTPRSDWQPRWGP